ncbi:MAG: hypothetical protein QM504_17895 [Pseudomonadota bacterium]
MPKKSYNKNDGFRHIERDNGKDKQYVRLSFYVLNSPEYRSLSSSAKILMQAMQMQHRANYYTSYGVKQACGVTGLSNRTITRSIKELLINHWLVIQSNYNHREAKTRTYELTWMSYDGKKPSDLWCRKLKKG